MSFTRLLAAGRSIMGIKPTPSPYRMNQEHLLPKFNQLPASAFSTPTPAAGTAAPPDLSEPPAVRPVAARPAARKGQDNRGVPVGKGGSVLGRLASGWAHLTRRPRRLPPSTQGRAVQTELSLDLVKVVRNDLTDSDAAEESRRRRNGEPSGRMQPLGMVWNRLSARLLRQAVQEFNVVQKERGKLLSHTDHGSGGPRGT